MGRTLSIRAEGNESEVQHKLQAVRDHLVSTRTGPISPVAKLCSTDQGLEIETPPLVPPMQYTVGSLWLPRVLANSFLVCVT